MTTAALERPPSTAARRASFEREALVHLDLLYRIALRLAGTVADAEDLVQDTMLAAYRAWDQYERGTNAKAWLVIILRRLFYDQYRRRTRRGTTVDLDAIEPFTVFPGLDNDPEGRFFEMIVDDEVLRAIDGLPEEFREVLVLHDSEGLRLNEIANILAVPVGTVKSRLFRARRRLQTKLYAYAVDAGYIAAAARDDAARAPAAGG